jgi:hypothetical protein
MIGDGEVRERLPFDAYPGGGQELPPPPRFGDATARKSYGLNVLRWCGYRCAYCGLDLGSFEGWLQVSVDQVVPQQAAKVGYPKAWVLSEANLVACCMACNGLFNRDQVVDAVPASWDAFLHIREANFLRRRARIRIRRETELIW